MTNEELKYVFSSSGMRVYVCKLYKRGTRLDAFDVLEQLGLTAAGDEN